MSAGNRVVEATRADRAEKIRFLLVGGWNTVFAYGMLFVLDSLLHDRLHYSLIITLNWVIGVTQNLVTYKLLVFRTKGNWLREYLRSFVVQLGSYFLSLAIVAVIMELWHPRLVVAALPAIIVAVVVSYLGYKHFTFRTRTES